LVPPVSHGAFSIKCSKTMIMRLFETPGHPRQLIEHLEHS
jgi:hypothetical protein